MHPQSSSPNGIWLPLITPFRDGELDLASLRNLVRTLCRSVDGLLLCATSGEALTLSETEKRQLVAAVREELDDCNSALPVWLGVAGSCTRDVAADVARYETWPVDGYLIDAPAYNRPGQSGLISHFEQVCATTVRACMIYNIPYRSGVNMTNDTLLQLAERGNIVGVKDCSGSFAQSLDLLVRRPDGFSVLTGEDIMFYTAHVHGAAGGVLISAHILGDTYRAIRLMLDDGNWSGAFDAWRRLAHLPGVLFAEPSPAPTKHWLWRTGRIASPELRLPMCAISDDLADRIDLEIERYRALKD